MVPILTIWSTGATSAAVALTPVSSTTYTVTGTSLGCSQTASGSITVLTAPEVKVIPQSICVGGTSSLFAYGAPSYTWSTGSTANPLIISPATTTTYTVTGLGCPNTSTGTVTVFPMPIITASSATICDGTSATMTAHDSLSNNALSKIKTYLWSTGSDSISITAAPHTTTTYSVIGATTFGCKDTAVGTIVVNPNPVVSATSVIICPGDIGTLSATGANSYLWSTGAITSSITASPALTTSYTVTGSTVWHCVGTAIGTIKVSKIPKAGFVASPNPTDIFNTEISFSNQSSVDVVYWHWNYGDGDTLAPNTASPIHTYSEQPGDYTVTLIVHNATPCWDTISSKVLIGPEFAFYIPNTFTPNGDHHNDGFRGRGVGIVTYKLQIFDRWGNFIWESEDIDEYWNGKANGGENISMEDTYVWKVFINDVFGREHHYIGTVNLIR